MQPVKHSPALERFTTRRVALIEGDRRNAEMLHTFFRLMELECSLIDPLADPVATVRRLDPDVLIVDLDLPDLRALDIARAFRRTPIIFLTDSHPTLAPIDAPVLPRPHGEFEELLRLFEMVIEVE